MLDRGEQYSCLWDLRASRIAPELLLFARMAGPLRPACVDTLVPSSAAAPRLGVRLALGSAVPYVAYARMAGPLQLSVLTPLAAAPRLSVRLALGSAVPYAWRDRCGHLC